MSGRSWPWPAENGDPGAEGTNTYDDTTIAVFEVLRRWFLALEDGTAGFWHPDPDYVRANGKPLSEGQVNRVIERALDHYLNQPVQRNYALNTRKIWHDAGPEFSRLAYPQRLALVQELCRAIEGTTDTGEEKS